MAMGNPPNQLAVLMGKSSNSGIFRQAIFDSRVNPMVYQRLSLPPSNGQGSGHPLTAQQDAPIFVSGWKLFRCRSLFRLLWRVLRSKGHVQWSAAEFLCFLEFWLNKHWESWQKSSKQKREGFCDPWHLLKSTGASASICRRYFKEKWWKVGQSSQVMQKNMIIGCHLSGSAPAPALMPKTWAWWHRCDGSCTNQSLQFSDAPIHFYTFHTHVYKAYTWKKAHVHNVHLYLLIGFVPALSCHGSESDKAHPPSHPPQLEVIPWIPCRWWLMLPQAPQAL